MRLKPIPTFILYSDSYVFQISSYFKPRKYYSGHVCHISSGIKLQGWMKFSETLRTSLKIWMGIIIISSTFYVSFLWILANEICFSSLCGYPPLSWSNRVSVLWSHHITSFAVNSSLYQLECCSGSLFSTRLLNPNKSVKSQWHTKEKEGERNEDQQHISLLHTSR